VNARKNINFCLPMFSVWDLVPHSWFDISNLDRVLVLRTALEMIIAFLVLKYITSKNVKGLSGKVELTKKVNLRNNVGNRGVN
jgi:hypothetical protein